MFRLIAALAVAVLSAPAVVAAQSAQAQAPAAAPATGTTTPPPATPPPATPPGRLTPPPSSTAELDPATRDLVRREVEKAKEEMRDEIRAEIQGAQSAREFMETSAAGERPKLDFLQLNGYLRVRGDLFDNLDLRRAPDPSGYYLFPVPLRDPEHRGTLTTANMRLRVEPTLNVSEQIRVLSQIDILDNVVLGSTPAGLFRSNAGVLLPFDSWTQTSPTYGQNSDRNSLVAKRAWGEVQTPIGLLSFGRMPSSFGLGILSHAGAGIDDDYGDTVDRIQFALTPLRTAIGPLVLVPMYQIVSTGVTSLDLRNSSGLGQPFDLDQSDDAKAIGIKIVRIDTEEEVRRKLERGESSVSFGAWYMYKTQSYDFPQWANGGAVPSGSATTPASSSTSPPSTGSTNPGNNDTVGQAVHRDAYAHTLDLWTRYRTKAFRWETELAGIIGEIGDARLDPTGGRVGPVLLRQFGGASQLEWTFGRWRIGGEAGFASGDRSPGFGNQPARGCITSTSGKTLTCRAAQPGDIDGAQFAPGDKVLDIRNFRFNPAYRVDLVLWRQILGNVTDAWYMKPTLRWEPLEGLALTAQIVYSQAMYASSTPSTVNNPLGIELDLGARYQSDDGFIMWLDWGLLQPLSGFDYPPNSTNNNSLTRGNAIRSGVAIKF